MAGGLPGLGIMVPTWLVGKFTIELRMLSERSEAPCVGDFPVMFDDTAAGTSALLSWKLQAEDLFIQFDQRNFHRPKMETWNKWI